MSEPEAPNAVTAPPKKTRRGLTFTDPGCRTDVRVGALLILAALFLWLWFGPATSAKILIAGIPLLLWGIPWQAVQARTAGRPGFPWKLGIAMTIMGACTWYDLRFREEPGGPLHVQVIGPMLTAAGIWILIWWPIAMVRPHSRSLS